MDFRRSLNAVLMGSMQQTASRSSAACCGCICDPFCRYLSRHMWCMLGYCRGAVSLLHSCSAIVAAVGMQSES